MYKLSMSQKVANGIYLHDCNRCDYQWTSKKQDPQTCANPKCRSPYWDKPRVK